MEDNRVHFRHLMLFFYRKGKNAARTARKTCDVYGEDVLRERTVRKWFARSKRVEFNFAVRQRAGRPSSLEEDQIKMIVEKDRHITTREIVERLNVPKSTVDDHLLVLGLVERLDVWVPHKLSERNPSAVSVRNSLLKRKGTEPFLKRMVAGDEKWILYNNVERKRSWSLPSQPPRTTPEAKIHVVKVMLCCWWDCKGTIYHELLPLIQTITSERCCSQLDNLKAAVDQMRLKPPG
nr:Transposase domain containing protein [Haemonchus contortus]